MAWGLISASQLGASIKCPHQTYFVLNIFETNKALVVNGRFCGEIKGLSDLTRVLVIVASAVREWRPLLDATHHSR